jgi:hypothetical protein
MKIRLTRNTVIGGVPYSDGEQVDVTERDAKYLLAIKKAVAVDIVEPERDTGEALVETAIKPNPQKAIRKGGKH